MEGRFQKRFVIISISCILLTILCCCIGIHMFLSTFAPEKANLDGTVMLSPDWFTFQQDAGLFTAKQDEFLAQLPSGETPS